MVIMKLNAFVSLRSKLARHLSHILDTDDVENEKKSKRILSKSTKCAYHNLSDSCTSWEILCIIILNE